MNLMQILINKLAYDDDLCLEIFDAQSEGKRFQYATQDYVTGHVSLWFQKVDISKLRDELVILNLEVGEEARDGNHVEVCTSTIDRYCWKPFAVSKAKSKDKPLMLDAIENRLSGDVSLCSVLRNHQSSLDVVFNYAYQSTTSPITYLSQNNFGTFQKAEKFFTSHSEHTTIRAVPRIEIGRDVGESTVCNIHKLMQTLINKPHLFNEEKEPDHAHIIKQSPEKDAPHVPNVAVVDMETLSLEHNALVNSLCIRIVNGKDGSLGNMIKLHVDIVGQLMAGSHISTETTKWWHDKEGDTAYSKEWLDPVKRELVANVCKLLNDFLAEHQCKFVMGCVPKEDNTWLLNLYKIAGVKPGWSYGKNIDLRTMRWLYGFDAFKQARVIYPHAIEHTSEGDALLEATELSIHLKEGGHVSTQSVTTTPE